ncbi:transmembrane and death domain protein 1-like [Brienomyrus brachyistius]|uniref:transmembrane and death domain protein 1-like n=1 Tax=Brienomyrus brachyistius TaxID=42636 RepID=UPI0020B21375|nr:transmembrane and death domain protein 1-like [Brienomyrus brachyistius]
METILLFFLMINHSLGGDTVATDLDKHQLWRLANILTIRECKDLLSVLSRPEPDIFLQINHLPLQDLTLQQVNQEPPNPWEADYKTPCNVVLMRWLVKNGKQIYFDRLYRALQQIGRTDIAKEMGKNINQDKILNLQRYVDGYHEYVKGIKSTLLEMDQRPQAEHEAIREGRDLTQNILRPAVERKQPPPYDRHPLDGVLPLLNGFLISVAGSVLVGLAILLLKLRDSRNDLQKLQ